MNTLLDTLWYFCYITVELVVLFIVITAIVEIILMYIPQEKISKKIEKAGFFGNVIAAGFGALTPFCACSTLPMTVGFSMPAYLSEPRCHSLLHLRCLTRLL